ncbi:MAG TPA: ABC transporter ATP-binding protein [Beijerinckiaceae bacterium]|nr:ABC transporter ATP-binding protein [Beijerinckiaceae bacterium]
MPRKLSPLTGDTIAAVARLWRDWMRPHRAQLAAVLALVILVAGATGLYPLIIKVAFDAFRAPEGEVILRLPTGPMPASARTLILYGPLFVIAATAIKGFSLLGLTVLTNRVVTRIEADMQTALYAHLIDADLAQLGRESPGALTQRFTTDFAFIKEALTRLSTVFLRETATIVALVVAMVLIDPLMTLMAAVIGPFVVRPIAKIGQKLKRVSMATQEQIGAMASLVSESLAGARVAKTYGMEAYLKQRVARTFDEIRRLKMKAANTRGRLDPLLEIGGGVAVAAVLAFISRRILAGESTIGDFTGFVSALILASQPVRALGHLNAIVQEAGAALKRTFAKMDEAPEIRERPDARELAVTKGEVRFERASFRYRDDAVALERVDLVAPAGRTTALIGRSGSGKSTLISLVPRLYDVTEGAVVIDGQDIRDVTLRSLRARIAVVSQDVVLFDDTVRANIVFGRPGASEEEIVEAAKAAAAHDFIMRLPEGYDAQVGHAGNRFSGGERQRISLARAFLKNAPILLLDEATSALDSESERLVQMAIARLMRGRTTLLIAHRLSTVREADLIVVMEEGKIVETGSHDALLSRGGPYARMQRLQVLDDIPPAA